MMAQTWGIIPFSGYTLTPSGITSIFLGMNF
jgi:hypothetical protein